MNKKFSLALVFTLSSALLLCLTHGYFPILIYIACLPFLLAILIVNTRQAFYYGLLCGAGESFILAGILHTSTLLFLALCLLYALFRAFYALGLSYVKFLKPFAFAMTSGAYWALLEYFHAHLPWTLPNLLGDTQHTGLLLPLARLSGTYGISFIVVSFQAWLAAVLYHNAQNRSFWWRSELRFFAFWPACALVGLWYASHVKLASKTQLTVASIQGGLPTWAYDQEKNKDGISDFPLRVYEHLTLAAPKTDLTIWPETAVWRVWNNDREYEQRVRRLHTQRGGIFLLGSLLQDDSHWLRNAVIYMDNKSDIAWRSKQRLALLAEAKMVRATEPIIFKNDQVNLGGVICLESVVPQYVTALAKEGVDLLIIFSDGSRFGQTPVGRMHAQRGIVRAVESGKTTVHAGQHGYSYVVDPFGKSSTMLFPFHKDSVVSTVTTYTGLTPFVCIEEHLYWLWLGIIICCLTFYRFRGDKQQNK